MKCWGKNLRLEIFFLDFPPTFRFSVQIKDILHDTKLYIAMAYYTKNNEIIFFVPRIFVLLVYACSILVLFWKENVCPFFEIFVTISKGACVLKKLRMKMCQKCNVPS